MKTSELIGPTLNWAVARCVTLGVDHLRISGKQVYIKDQDTLIECKFQDDWGQGGPIIDKEGIEIVIRNPVYFPKGNENGDYWEPLFEAVLNGTHEYGPTPLISGMRCFVASKLGNEVEIPEALK